MDVNHLRHKDERFGHVAVDMGLMTPHQVALTSDRILQDMAMDTNLSFGRTAMEMGFLTDEQRQAIDAEERRRRRLIQGYEIIDIIGKGTIATVYHARQLSMDREVALKILHPRLASDPVFVRAYIAEAQAVSRFHHPYIVQGFDAGQSNGFYYFAHEYLPGGSVADALAQGEAAHFSETRILTYLRQTTSALKHAWAVAVYHGDINPGNLLRDALKNIKLANLGVPRVAGLRSSREGKGGFMHGFVRCGPDYAAPEQLDKPDLVDARTDMYNLGATFYHISFGVPPFRPTPHTNILEYRGHNPVPSFSLKRQEDFSGKYLRLLHDMLEPDPDKRPQDPEQLAERLERFHIADGDELNALARSARQVAGPSTSGRMSQRLERAVSVPSPTAAERSFSLRRRQPRSGRMRLWLAVMVAVLLAALAAWLVL